MIMRYRCYSKVEGRVMAVSASISASWRALARRLNLWPTAFEAAQLIKPPAPRGVSDYARAGDVGMPAVDCARERRIKAATARTPSPVASNVSVPGSGTGVSRYAWVTYVAICAFAAIWPLSLMATAVENV